MNNSICFLNRSSHECSYLIVVVADHQNRLIYINAMASFEWVYDDGHVEEPEVLEADSVTTANSSSYTPTSLQFVYEIQPDDRCLNDEGAIVGDEGVDESAVDPVQAFETFAGRSFPHASTISFGDEIYNQALHWISPLRATKQVSHDSNTPSLPLESRSRRMARLRNEIDQMTLESEQMKSDVLQDDKRSSLLELDDMRRTLDRFSSYWRSEAGPSPAPLLVKGTSAGATIKHVQHDKSLDVVEGIDDKSQGSAPTLIEVYPRDSLLLPSFDQRLSSLERKLPPLLLKDGPSELWDMASSLQRFLEDTDSSSLSDLRSSLDHLFKTFASNPHLGEFADATMLLKKLEGLERERSLLPILAARLRSLKNCLDDATNVARVVSELSSKYEALEQAHAENMELVSRLKETLQSNLLTVQSNMDVIEERLRLAMNLRTD